MKIKIRDRQAVVYNQMSRTSTPIETLYLGDVVELGQTRQNEGEKWVEAHLAEDKLGYLPGVTNTFPVHQFAVRIPITGDTVVVQFPDRCALCAGPKETSLETPYDETRKKHKRFMNKLNLKFEIPYCSNHAQISQRVRKQIMYASYIRLGLSTLAAIAGGSLAIYDGNYLGFTNLGMKLVIILGCAGGFKAFFDLFIINPLWKLIIPRWIKSYKQIGTGGRLGISIGRAPERDSLLFFFLNEEFAREFEQLNQHT
jgi:hypothetical protein